MPPAGERSPTLAAMTGAALQVLGKDLRAHYTTSDTSGPAAGHTAQMVPLFADGPGADRFGRIIDNAEVGRRLRAMIERGHVQQP